MKSPFQQQLLSQFRDAYGALLGQPLDLWINYDGSWHHAIEAVEYDAESRTLYPGVIAPQSLSRLSRSLEEPAVEELSPGLYLVGIPLAVTIGPDRNASEAATGWGTVQASFSSLVKTLYRTSRERMILQHEVNEFRTGLAPHLEQITYDFEQLTWLRRLSEQVELCDSANPLREMAEKILPDLCQLAQAEGLVYVETLRSGPHDEFPLSRAGRPLFWAGRQLLNDDQCAALVESLCGDRFPGESIVRNHLDHPADWDLQIAPGIHSCVQVPILHRSLCYGWLVALNRIPWRLRAGNTTHSVPAGFCDDEFGTAESSMLNSAAATLASCARNSELLREKELLLIGVVRSLINSIDAKDAYTCGHSDRVAMMARCIGERMRLPAHDCERLYMSGLLHDIGKIGVPDSVLLKPGKLTEEEFALIRQHPTIGHGILKHLPQLSYVLPGVLHHHESYDGRGYPHGLRGEEIPLFGRILAVADAYDAMTSARPYRSAMPTERAEGILTAGAGIQWDRTVVKAFLEAIPEIRRACERSVNHIESLLRPNTERPSTWHDLESDSIVQAISTLGL